MEPVDEMDQAFEVVENDDKGAVVVFYMGSGVVTVFLTRDEADQLSDDLMGDDDLVEPLGFSKESGE